MKGSWDGCWFIKGSDSSEGIPVSFLRFNEVMKSDWLPKFIIDTKLIGNASLSGKEYQVMMAYLKNGKSNVALAQEIGLSGEGIGQIIDKAFEKLLFTIVDSMAKATLLQKTLSENDALKKELIQLKTKFKKQLADDQQLKFDFTQPNVSIDEMRFSIRAGTLWIT